MAIEMEKGSVSIDAQNIMPVIKRWLYSDKDIFLREVVSKLQTMRKEGGMEVTDRIRVTFAAAGYAADVLAKNREAIMGEVLAVAFDAGEPAGYVKEWDVNGEPVTFGVEKAALA